MQLDFSNKPKVHAAYGIAVQWHRGQVRKYTGEPYFTHPVRVAEKLLTFGITDQDALAAALLHDVLEDTDCPAVIISDRCGEKVLRYVRLLTNTEKGKRTERKAAAAKRISAAPEVVHAVKLADIIDNLTGIATHDPAFARVYLAEKKAMIDALPRLPLTHVMRTAALDVYAAELNQLAVQELAIGLEHQALAKAEDDFIASILNEEEDLIYADAAMF